MTSGGLYAVLGYGCVNMECFASGFTCIFLGLTHVIEELEAILLASVTLAPTEVCCFVSS